MSRNNLIGVIKHRRMYYVLRDLNADNEWNYENCVNRIGREDTVSRSRRGQALCAAHNLQRAIQTEYGVREIRRGD